MPKVLQSIESFLKAQLPKHNGPDLLERILRHVQNLEFQVNVAAGDGFPVPGKRSTYSDGLDEWWNIRIPKNSATVPTFTDYSMSWPLDLHADSIGCTGWDWRNKRSLWVGFDFDAISGHAAGVGVSKDALDAVRESACNLPYIEVRASTGGSGLHLYALLEDEGEGVPCENHTVHAALGRAILGMMSSAVNFDFASHIDACGGNMWVWGRKSTPENGGLRLVKPAIQHLTQNDLPANWRDHVEVVSRKRSKVRVNSVEESSQDAFDYLTSSRKIVPLDKKHNEIIDELRASGYTAMWVSDHHLLQTHTGALHLLMEEKRDSLGLLGFFRTISEGKDRGTPNCFLFPLENGSFKVYRFSPGIVEAETWEQDGEGWTTCYFNRSPTLKVAAKAMGGKEDPDRKDFVFTDQAEALAAVKALGQTLTLPVGVVGRETRLKPNKDGRLVVLVKKGDNDDGMSKAGWIAKKDYWIQIFETRTNSKSQDMSVNEYDGLVRCLVTPTGECCGWLTKSDGTNGWNRGPKDNAKSSMQGRMVAKAEVDVILGLAVNRPWIQVNRPFEPPYPGDRQWNKDAAQYRFKPADLNDEEELSHPTWDMVLQHCGQDLDQAIRNLEWAQKANIRTGAQYLLAWIACLLREPYSKLPYLFLYGDQNNGKSSLHKAIARLLSGGVVSADKALTSEFNGELANAVLCYVEETDLSKSKNAYNKMKDWTTNDEMWIRRMRTDLYKLTSTFHCIQTANEREYCPIKFGDTRITMMYVPLLDPDKKIAPSALYQRLEEEAPHFMRTLMDLQLPPIIDRMRLPVVNSSTKERAEAVSRNPLEEFIGEHCYETRGRMVLLKEFRDRFDAWLDQEYPSERAEWSNSKKIVQNLPHRFPYGAYTANQRFIGNMSWEQSAPSAETIVVNGGRLSYKKD